MSVSLKENPLHLLRWELQQAEQAVLDAAGESELAPCLRQGAIGTIHELALQHEGISERKGLFCGALPLSQRVHLFRRRHGSEHASRLIVPLQDERDSRLDCSRGSHGSLSGIAFNAELVFLNIVHNTLEQGMEDGFERGVGQVADQLPGIRESLADVQTGQLRVAGSHDGKHRLILRVVYKLGRHHALNLRRREVRVLAIFSATGAAYAGIVPVHSPLAGGIRDTHLAPATGAMQQALQGVEFAEPIPGNQLRYSVDSSDESLGKKIKRAVNLKIPVVIVVGARDASERQLSLRLADREETIAFADLSAFLQKLAQK